MPKMDSDKKISFGFSKSIKKTTLQPKPKLENNKQLIDCLESQSIKIKNEVLTDKGPLVIPVKKNEKRLGNNHEQDEKTGNDGIDSASRSLDEIAAEEILNDLKNAKENKLNPTALAIPIKKDKTDMIGEQPTLDDYENVQIQDFGRAVLRGMGWKGDVKKKPETVMGSRLKGLGLGADKSVKLTTKVAVDEKGEELKLIKGAFVKVIGGRHKDLYGQVEGMDDERGTIFVKMALGKNILTFYEVLLTPVPKTEYEKNSKVLNMTKYEEYKKSKLSKRAESRSPSRNRSRSVSRDREKRSSKTKNEQSEKNSKRDNSSEDNESRNKDRKYERYYEKRSYSNDKGKREKNNKRSKSSSDSDDEKYDRHSSRSKNNEKYSRKTKHSDTEDDEHSNHKKYKEKSRSKHSRRSSTDSETKDKYSKYKKDRNSTEKSKTNERRNENDDSNDDRHRHWRDRSVDRSRKSKYESIHHKHSSKKSKRRSRSRSR